ENGRPLIKVNGPEGFSEIAQLLAARGPGGFISFDPNTGAWYAFNGQDIPWNNDFTRKGLSFLGSPDGARGIAEDNRFAPVPRPSSQQGLYGLGPISVPSWPEQTPLAALMLLTILGGVLAVRMRKHA
ncbi:MAG TPA: hypothetical protein VGQ00_00090, partial [Candidatus Norongarragalinales archaeon]|nr:hypothetical protein [Candidatus Norongarragalinales archaeon]